MSEDYKTIKTRIDSALDECGIGYNLDQRLGAKFDAITDFCAMLQKRALSQGVYDELTNRPMGRHRTPTDALKSAIVGAIGELCEWEIYSALNMAADIAEDVNAHSEATAIRAMALTEVAQ